jgi:hypothetical protein
MKLWTKIGLFCSPSWVRSRKVMAAFVYGSKGWRVCGEGPDTIHPEIAATQVSKLKIEVVFL